MCRELRSLGQSIAVYAGSFDARGLTPGQAAEVVRLCARIEASAASIKALAAARSAEGGDWKLAGYRSPADQLAHATGMSPAAANRALETGRRRGGGCLGGTRPPGGPTGWPPTPPRPGS